MDGRQHSHHKKNLPPKKGASRLAEPTQKKNKMTNFFNPIHSKNLKPIGWTKKY
jgi:hypothetical protein